MFIRQTQTRSTNTGESYFTHRLVESRRVGRKVSQHTLLNLGSNFDLPTEAWPELCTRVEQILNSLSVVPFDLLQARCHARIWAELQSCGSMIGVHDLQIAAAGIALSHGVATLNVGEFQRVPGLVLVDATPFRNP